MCNFAEVAIPLESPGHLEKPHICVLVNSTAEVPDDGQHQLPDVEVKMPSYESSPSHTLSLSYRGETSHSHCTLPGISDPQNQSMGMIKWLFSAMEFCINLLAARVTGTYK